MMVDMDLIDGLPDELEVLWDGGTFIQHLDYWKISFRYHLCRLTGHSKEAYPSRVSSRTGSKIVGEFSPSAPPSVLQDIPFPIPLDTDSALCFVGILLTGSIIGLKEPVHLLDIYGPYDDRWDFWEAASNSGLLKLPNLIMGGL